MSTPKPKPYDKTTHGGKTVDWLTKAALQKAERILGYDLDVVQGSYNAGGVSASAGTHDGGGAVDLKPYDWQSKVRALRLSGFAAYYRPELKGTWNAHIHAILTCDKAMSAGAASQVRDFRNGLDGLAGHHADPHKGLVFHEFHWPYAGFTGSLRWRRDHLKGAERESFIKDLRRVANGK